LTPPPDDHDCGWKAYAKAQEQRAEAQRVELAELRGKLAELERRFLGKRSEKRKHSKMPPPVAPKNDPAAAEQKRRDAQAERDAKLETQNVPLPLTPEQCVCPECGNEKLRSVGFGKPSVIFEYVHAHFRKRVFWRETRACRCGVTVREWTPGRRGAIARGSGHGSTALAVVLEATLGGGRSGGERRGGGEAASREPADADMVAVAPSRARCTPAARPVASRGYG